MSLRYTVPFLTPHPLPTAQQEAELTRHRMQGTLSGPSERNVYSPAMPGATVNAEALGRFARPGESQDQTAGRLADAAMTGVSVAPGRVEMPMPFVGQTYQR